ncbi:MAG: hypothetical protein CM1200mP12_11690 [Gammaproteobacteria bacterium]|nr:MAG: hypothetical protein CM1200mP12_11690 [Gammaproteobacteria bacterium]
MKHYFLLSLEESKCVGEGTGWYPFHLLVKEDEDVIALMPMYIKTDSQENLFLTGLGLMLSTEMA